VVRGTEQRTLVTKLIQAYEWFDDALIDWMHAHGSAELTRSSSMIFSYLDPEGSRPADLARRIGVSRQAVHKTLNEMVEIGLVELVADPDDQRAKLVILTPRGREWVELARSVLAGLERELEARIGHERMLGLRAALAVDWGEPPEPTFGSVLLPAYTEEEGGRER
jgi:DNA-binding MarR family transcriptional regulator